MSERFRNQSGVTLVEIIVVIAIVVVLVVLAVPFYHHALDTSRRGGCVSNLHQLGQGLNLFANEHGGQFPGMGLDGAGPWDVQIQQYLTENSDKVFACPTDLAVRREHGALEKVRSYTYNPIACSYDERFVEYGANEQVGQGIRQASIVNPSQFPMLFEHHDPVNEKHRNTLGTYTWIVGLKYSAHGAGENSVYADGHVAYVPSPDSMPEFPQWTAEFASNLPR